MTWWARRGRAAGRAWRWRTEYCVIGLLAPIGVTWETLGVLGIAAVAVPTLPYTLHWFVVGMALAVVSVASSAASGCRAGCGRCAITRGSRGSCRRRCSC